jgi:hypothetical protein
MTPANQEVHRRHVFFLSGFDPKGAAHYHALYEAEALKQSAVNALALHMGPRQREVDGNSTWSVSADLPDGRCCQTTYEFARWDDIVRRHWPRSTWRLLLDMLVAYALVLRSGGLATVWKVSRKTLVGLAYPVVVLGGGLAVSVALGVALALWLTSALHAWDAIGGTGGIGVRRLVAGLGGVLVLGLGLACTRWLEARLNTTWLVRIFSFAGKLARGQVPELEGRMDDLAAKLAKKIRARDVDEILVVGFSVGSILAVSVVARALKSLHVDGERLPQPASAALSLLTLGHCIPMLGLLPEALVFRQELALLARAGGVRWIDFSSVTDWGSFALADPVEVCKVLPATPAGGLQAANPTMRSPRFHALFAPALYARLRRNKRRMHLQYLMAADLPGEYDYFAITAGAKSLRNRYPGG